MANYEHLWKNNERIDKPHLSVRQEDNQWVIMIGDTVAMRHCPCCLLPFANKRYAMRCVDAFWPGAENDEQRGTTTE